MSARRCVLAAVFVSLGIPGWVAAQGLGETAARERDRRAKEAREKSQEPGQVYTNDDLKAIHPPGEEPSESAESSSSTDEDTTAEPSRSRRRGRIAVSPRGGRDGEDGQGERLQRAQQRVDQLESRIQELNGKLNPMSMDYIYGAAQTGDVASEELRIRAELNDLETQLAQARQELAAAQEARSAAPTTSEPSPPSDTPQ